jgi:acyl-CoA synthetase (AMP-forming)/AMP-acid ligase II
MIFRSPLPDVAIPETPFTSYVLRHAAELADKAALVDGPSGRTLSYSQLADAIRRAATGLAQRGFQKGDVFAIYSPNLPEYAVAFHAVATLGGVNTTVSPLYTVHELTHQLRDAGAKYLVTVPPFLDNALAAARAAGVREVFVFGEGEGATPFATLLQNQGDLPAVPINPKSDLVVLPYSSGTTGLPKGVMLTHHNLVANLVQIEASAQPPLRVIEADMLMGILPFFHIYGMVIIMSYALAVGATVVTMPRFDLAQFLQLIQQYRITYAHLVPPLVLALAKHPLVDQYDLSSLRTVVSGAAPLGADVQLAAARRLHCVITQGYGMTEASPVTHFLDDPSMAKAGSIGPVIPNTEAMVVDVATGQPLGPNEQGELWIRGPQVMQGYLNNPQATANTLDREGWLHTGDIGYATAEGDFYIVDRLKELIKYKGLQVAPAELEATLLTHPAVADAAVIGVPDEEAGEVPKAFVVLRGEASAADILAHVAEHVAPYKKIRHLEFIEQIPKSASGKILRRLLVEREQAKSS